MAGEKRNRKFILEVYSSVNYTMVLPAAAAAAEAALRESSGEEKIDPLMVFL